MIHQLTPLSEAECRELDMFLLYEVDTEECMTLDMMDGFLHAIAVGPITLKPSQWLPKIWGTTEMMPPMESLDHLNHILGLVMRHYNGIIHDLESTPSELNTMWDIRVFDGKEYDDAETWAYGFVEGMKLCWEAWQPLLTTPEGKAWYRPIGLLGEDDFGPEQDALTKTPAQRAELSIQIPDAVLEIYAYWLPIRHATYEREVAKALHGRVGRNDPCPCGSNVKFKKCCGSANNLH